MLVCIGTGGLTSLLFHVLVNENASQEQKQVGILSR